MARINMMTYPFGRFSMQFSDRTKASTTIKHLESHHLHVLKYPSIQRGDDMPIGANIYIVAGEREKVEIASHGVECQFYIALGL